jgi:hypothetical protein
MYIKYWQKRPKTETKEKSYVMLSFFLSSATPSPFAHLYIPHTTPAYTKNPDGEEERERVRKIPAP